MLDLAQRPRDAIGERLATLEARDDERDRQIRDAHDRMERIEEQLRGIRDEVARGTADGVGRAMRELGLADEDAGRDVREMRNFIGRLRHITDDAATAVVRTIITLAIGAFIAFLGLKGVSSLKG
jgi:hypothetical protein